MTPRFLAKIIDGKINFQSEWNEARFREFCKNHEGKILRIELSKNAVSEKIRGYYFGAVIPTVKASVKDWENISSEDVHEILKKLFNYFDALNPITKRIERFGRSAMGDESNSVRAMDFLEKIRVWLAEDFGVEMPNPEEYKKINDMAILK